MELFPRDRVKEDFRIIEISSFYERVESGEFIENGLKTNRYFCELKRAIGRALNCTGYDYSDYPAINDLIICYKVGKTKHKYVWGASHDVTINIPENPLLIQAILELQGVDRALWFDGYF